MKIGKIRIRNSGDGDMTFTLTAKVDAVRRTSSNLEQRAFTIVHYVVQVGSRYALM